MIIEDSSHAGLGCVRSAQEGGFLRYDLGKVSGTVAQAGGQGGEGVDVAAQAGVDADPVPVGPVVCHLESAEQPRTARYCGGDEAELP